MSRIDIIIPPLALNTVPNYGVAHLKSYMESKGHEVTIRDFDKELYVPEVLEELRPRYSHRLELESVLKMPTHTIFANLFYRPEEVREFVKVMVAQESLYEGEELEKYVDMVMASLTTKAIEAGHRRWVREILDGGADVVAISIGWHSALPSALRLARDLKNESPETPIVAGGCSVHNSIGGLEKIQWIDHYVVGEGEKAFETIANELKEGKEPSRVVQGTPLDINELPLPDFDGFDLGKYRYVLSSSISRGCIYKCRFCVERALWPVYRRKRPEVVVREMKNGIERFGCSQFFFTDSLVNGDVNVLTKVCETLRKEELDTYWAGQASTRKMSREVLQTMASGGARMLCYGIETASKATIERMGKGTDVDFTRDVIRWSWETGIWTCCFMLLGFPGERKEDVEENYRFLEENKDCVGSAVFHRFQLLRYSDVYTNQERYGVRSAPNRMLDRVKDLLLSGHYEVSNGLSYRQSLEQEVYARNYFNPRNRLTTFPPMTREEYGRFREKKMAA